MYQEMRRKDKLVDDRKWIDEVLNEAETIFVAMNGSDGMPYMLPLSFGYDGEFIYLHGAMQGQKIDLLKKDGRVCFHTHINLGVVRGELASDFSFKYRSVTGYGKVEFIDDSAEKTKALNCLMDHYKGPHVEEKQEDMAQAAHTWAAKIVIDHITGKQSPAPK